MKSLFCIHLETAGYVVGWLNLVVSILSTILVLSQASAVWFPQREHNQIYYENYEKNDYWVYYIGTDDEPISNKRNKDSIFDIWFSFSVSAISLIKSVFLLLGIKKQNHLMMLPWLVSFGLVLIGLILLKTWTFIGQEMSNDTNIGWFVRYGISIYIFIGMLSLYNQIRLSRDEQPKKNQVDL